MARHYLALVSVVAGALIACDGPAGCGDSGGASGDLCAPDPIGFGAVEGRVLDRDGVGLGGEQAYVSCGPIVGGYDDLTDDSGRFRVVLVYAPFDTITYPVPRRVSDGRIVFTCEGAVRLKRSNTFVLSDPFEVAFAPTEAGVSPAAVVLREPAE